MESRKLYIGGLPPSTQQEELKHHFGRYGEVLCVRVVRNHDTGLGRGIAFVEFANDQGPKAALNEKEKDRHVFGGHTVNVKRARVRPMRYQTEHPFYLHLANQIPVHNQWYNQSSSYNSYGYNSYAGNGYRGSDPHKVFVGGLRSHVTKEDLKNYFEKFGTITDVVLIREGLTQKPRGFGFITFDSEEAMAKVLQNSFHDLNGTKVETKMAIPRDCTYNQDRLHSPMIWSGSNYPVGYGGVYPPHNMQYIINNNYMVPFQQYMYSPHTFAARGAPAYTGSGTDVGYNSFGTNRLDVYSESDSKLDQVVSDDGRAIDIQEANISNLESLKLESKNIP